MVSLAKVSAVIDDADIAFQKCWSTLECMKERRLQDPWPQRFADFQEDLARALFKLDDLYRSISREKSGLISKKTAMDAERFRGRMKRLDMYQEALRDAIQIGKSLGDVFAWFFYQAENHLIAKHLQHPGNLHTPPGIGGLGEIGFTERFKIFDNHVAIYHGTTNFLRIGDVSFIHLPTMTVSAIGELKTEKVDEKTLNTTLIMLGDPGLPQRMPSLQHARPSSKKRVPMPAVHEDRLRRQMKKMTESLVIEEAERRLETRQDLNIDPIIDLLDGLKTTLAHKKLDDGLTIVGVRGGRRGTKLSSRLLPRSSGDATRATESAASIALDLVDKSAADNRLLMNRVRVAYVPGTTPLFWGPLPTSLLKPLFFDEAAIWTWLNPVHLVRKLRGRGFDVETNTKGIPTTLRKRFGSRTAVAQGIDQYLVLLVQCLFTEEAFVRFIEQMFEAVEGANVSSHTSLYMPLIQHFGDPPPDRETRIRRAARRGRR